MTASEFHPPPLSTTQIRAIDAAAIETYGIPGIVLMENAALGVVGVIESILPDPAAAHVVIACGAGNNGGDGWAIARHLHNRGARVSVVAVGEPREGTDAATNAMIARRMGIAERSNDESWGEPDLAVDALFGTGLDRPVEGAAAAVVARLNDAGCPVVAVDVPSGLNADTGQPLGPCVRASDTVTFVAPKVGFADAAAAPWIGTVHVASIGAPRELIERIRSSG